MSGDEHIPINYIVHSREIRRATNIVGFRAAGAILKSDAIHRPHALCALWATQPKFMCNDGWRYEAVGSGSRLNICVISHQMPRSGSSTQLMMPFTSRSPWLSQMSSGRKIFINGR